jgi:DNA replication and repair protein RecF
MHIENLSLVNFKNYPELHAEFSPSVNCLVGDNGSGKTNLLDAIHYLSFTKSAFNPVDAQSIRHSEDFYSIRGTFTIHAKRYEVKNALINGQRKRMLTNDVALDKASDHIGRFPLVLITPYDTGIIMEGSEARRRFVDSMLAQIDRDYLDQLIVYGKALKQRNTLLKQFAERRYFDADILEPYDELMLTSGRAIATRRALFCTAFEPAVLRHFREITEGVERIEFKYDSDFLHQNYADAFRAALNKDRLLQRSTRGTHRDDFIFEIDGYPLKKFGSQGQQKSYLLALKLAQFDMLHQEKGFKPILLMDDVFDKLDDHRIAKLMQMIERDFFGQIFITDARPERTRVFLEKIKVDRKIFMVRHGHMQVTEL